MRVALVTPLSGPLAEFGRAGAVALRLWARSAGVPRSVQPVELSVHDSGPGMAKALRSALDDRPDLLFGPYGNAQADEMARGTGRLIWNHGGAGDRMSRHGHVVNVLSPASCYFTGAVELLHRDISTVTVLHARTPFGRDVGMGAERAAIEHGLMVHRIGFEPGAAIEAVGDAPPADAVMMAAGFEDERSAAPLLRPGPWRERVMVGAGEQDVLAGLGGAREEMLGPAQWLADDPWEPDEGPEASWFIRNYADLADTIGGINPGLLATDPITADSITVGPATTGRNGPGIVPPYPAAQAFAAGVIAARCIREVGGLDDDALRAAAASLRCTTMYGGFELDGPGTQVGHQMLTVRWRNGRRHTVWPRPSRPTRRRHPAATGR